MPRPSIVSSPSLPDNRPSDRDPAFLDPDILPFPGTRSGAERASDWPNSCPEPVRVELENSRAQPAEEARQLDVTRREIQRLYRDAAQLAQADVSVAEFSQGLLDRLLDALGSSAGRLWIQSRSGEWELICQTVAPDVAAETLWDSPSTGPPSHLQHLIQGTERAIAVSPSIGGNSPAAPACPAAADLSSGEGACGPGTGPSGEAYLRLLARFPVDDRQVGVIEIFHRLGANEAAQRGYLRFVIQMSDLAGDYFRRHQLRHFRQQEVVWSELEQFVALIHGKLDQRHVAYHAANEGRRLIGCDRVSVVRMGGGSGRVLAISGMDTFNSRADNVRALRRLTEAVLRARQPVWYPSREGDLPPQIEKVLHAYLDQSQARALAVLPLDSFHSLEASLGAPGDRGSAEFHCQSSPSGALICEQLRTTHFEPARKERAEGIARHTGLALANAREHQGLLFLPLWKGLSKLARLLAVHHLPKTLFAVGLFCSLILGLVMVPADFQVSARGKLLPAHRREVFAHLPGIITQIHARHADRVEEGQLLLTMRSTDIAVGLSELEGQRGRTVEQIFAKEQLLLRNSRLSPVAQDQIAGELDELKQALESIEQRIELSREKESRLYVRSPMTGEVVTWQVDDALERRPVSMGQVLMSIIDPEGPWELEIHVPERRLGHVLQASEATADPLRAYFQLSTHPGESFEGEVVEIQRMAELRGDQGNTIALRVAIHKEELPHLHHETSVTARIQCGHRPLGFVLFQDLIETVQATWAYLR
jgi:hypothetical protein